MLPTQKGHCSQPGRFFLFQFDTAKFEYGMNMFLLKFSYTNTEMNSIVWIEYFQRNIASKAF